MKVDVDSISSYQYNTLIFYVNGRRVEEKDIDPKTTLATYIRDHLHLTGTKIGCNEGGCGACTVMISEIEIGNGKVRHYSANSCLMPICAVFGKAITTVEGIGSVVNKKLHPVQDRLARTHGSQCGFCTPGFIMAMYSLLRNNATPNEAEINEALQGNLCRCTGYRPILEAFYSFAVKENGEMKIVQNGCSMGEKCCRMNSKVDGRQQKLKLTDLSNLAPYDQTQEFIFPPELKLKAFHNSSFAFNHHSTIWYQPTDYSTLLSLKRMHPYARIISGNSELAIELKFKFIDLKMAINPRQIAELHEIRIDPVNGVYLGTGLSLTEMDANLKAIIQKLPVEECRIFKSVHWMMHWFAGKHVRNVASVAGNIATASPISDLNPIWMAANAKLHILTLFPKIICVTKVVLESEERGERILSVDEQFFLGYRKTVIEPDEVVRAILIPFTKKHQYFRAYKQAQRREDDIAIVTGAFNATVNPNTFIVEDIKISYGGMAPTTKLALNAMKELKGMKWSQSMLDRALSLISDDFPLPPGVPGGMARYRQALTLSFFMKFFLDVAKKLNVTEIVDRNCITEIGQDIPHKLLATQVYEEVPSCQTSTDPIGRPIPHASGEKHTTGEAVYCNDIQIANCLHMAFVMSPVACGTLQSVDTSKALEMEGVVAYIDAMDVKNGAKLGHDNDTPIFVKDKITYHGQPIGAIIAENHELARKAANAVKVEITTSKAIISIEDAIAVDSYLTKNLAIHSSLLERDTVVQNNWEKYDHIIEGEIKIGGQEHFYLETQQCVAIPLEDNEMEIISSTQAVSDVQAEIAKCLEIPAHKLIARVKRIGGGFGGKESTVSIIAVPAAIAAQKYQILYLNQISFAHRILFLFCIFRGFGGPQGMFCTETIIKHIAEELNIDHDKLREINFYDEGECTPFGMHLRQCNIKRTWYECKEFSDYERRLHKVREFNRQGQLSNNKYRKRGIYIMPTRFGIGFGIKQLNQAGALVMIYKDGSVLVNHGGMEMGQGLHTKILQIAARCLDIPIEKIHIHETSTDKVPNTSPTAASVGSDMNGLAVQDACNILIKRLEPFKKANPDGTWEEWIRKAYSERISLSATGFGILFSEQVDFFNGKGAELFGYCVYGTACCEVEVDCMTGDHYVVVFTNPGNYEFSEGVFSCCLVVEYLLLQEVFLVHFVDFVAVLLLCDGPARIQEVVVDDSTCRAPNTGHDLLSMQLQFGEVFWSFILVQPPHGTPSVVVENPFFVTCLNAIKKWIDFLAQKKHRADFVTAIFWYSFNSCPTRLSSFFDFPIWCKCRTTAEWTTSSSSATSPVVLIRSDGVRLTRGPGTYKIPSADDAPKHFNVGLLKGSSNKMAIFSSKAIGEPPLFLGACAFFAIREAIRAFRLERGLTSYFRFDSPATPENIRMTCEDEILAKVPKLPKEGTYTPWTVTL
uniref:xanthine dehydrogenase n=1 Tax=Heterorhabditis bacteriophora TaxID=37862 RepID=A0A1I7XKX7_HETBA